MTRQTGSALKRYHDIAAQIEAMIDSGEVPMGDYLPSERMLMARFGVGRPSVREALFSLQQSGRVQIANGSRARVVEPTAAAVIQQVGAAAHHLLRTPDGERYLDEARAVFEVAVVRHAAQHATREDLDRIAAALEANRAAVGRPMVFYRTDIALHRAFAQTLRNPIFPALQQGLVEWQTEQRMVTIEMPDADEISYRDHAAIVDAITARDPDRAEQAMSDHLRFVSEVYRAVKLASREIFREITRSVAEQVQVERAAAQRPAARRRTRTSTRG